MATTPRKSALKAKSCLTMRRAPTSEVVALLFSAALLACGAFIMSPNLPYFAMEHESNAFHFALMSSMFSLCQMISSPVIGMLSDRVGRRPVLLAGLATSAVIYYLQSLATNMLKLLVARAGMGVASGTGAVAIAYLLDLTSKEDRAYWIGFYVAIEKAGALVGPLIGCLLAPYGFHVLCYMMSGTCAFALVVGVIFLTEPEHLFFRRPAVAKQQSTVAGAGALDLAGLHSVLTWSSFLAYFVHKVTGPLLVAGFLDSLAFAISDGPEAYYLAEKYDFSSPMHFGKFLVTCSTFSLLSASCVRWILMCMRPKIACISYSLCNASIGIAFSLARYIDYPWWAPYLYASAFGFAGTIVQTISRTTLLSCTVPDRQRGAVYGIENALVNAGIVLGAPLGGLIFMWTDKALSYTVAGLVFCASAIFLAVLPGGLQSDAGKESLLGKDESLETLCGLEHLGNMVPLPNKRFAPIVTSTGDKARNRVYFVDPDIYDHFQQRVLADSEDGNQPMRKLHTIDLIPAIRGNDDGRIARTLTP